MFLSISTTYQPATDLGYLMRKNPANIHRADLSFGQSVIFYPQASEEKCEAVMMLDVDPVQLVRGRRDRTGAALLDHYVNDRPYAASSFLSVAMARSLRDAMAGRAPEREALAETEIPLEIKISPLPCAGGEAFLKQLFEPLGYEVQSQPALLDDQFPNWGDSKYQSVRLITTKRVCEALTHIYVLVPVLDNSKHYWIGDDEVEKLIEKGGEWLQTHPERELIANRYLRRRKYAREALAILDDKFGIEEEPDAAKEGEEEEILEKPMGLNAQRYEAVTAALLKLGARRICDLGCGDGKFLARLMKEKDFKRIIGFDVSTVELEKAERRLKLERMSPTQRERIDIFRGSLVYDDKRLEGYDVITLVEVIEHVDAERLDALERVVFAQAKPGAVIVSTPNVEYNALFETMAPDQLRHKDHRFEWTRAEFEQWANSVCGRQGYMVQFEGIGEAHAKLGYPTQMAIFERGIME